MQNIIKNRFIFFWISGLLFLISVFAFFWVKLNLWIDMTWGIQIEYDYQNTVDMSTINTYAEQVKKSINSEELIINDVNSYKVTWQNTFVVNAWFVNSLDDKVLEEYKMKFKEDLTSKIQALDETIVMSRYINIWKSFWDYIKETAKLTLFIAIGAIALYIAYAFSWAISWISAFTFAIVTVITLFHDVVISTWMYIFTGVFFPEFKIDTFFVTALLTILGYSINDTIVVFDRIRANLKIFWGNWKDLNEIITLSIKETIVRSIYTSLTLLFVLFTIFFFWPDTVSWFILVMIFGTVVWTFSSIFIASPLLYEINKDKVITKYVKKVVNPDDKIVV